MQKEAPLKLKIKSLSKLLSMMSENDLCDIYRIRNPEAKRFTWRRKSPFKERRLDCFLVSDTLQENIKAVGIIWGGDFNLFSDVDLDAEGGSP